MKYNIIKIFDVVACVFAFGCTEGMNVDVSNLTGSTNLSYIEQQAIQKKKLSELYDKGFNAFVRYGLNSPQYEVAYKEAFEKDPETASHVAKSVNLRIEARYALEISKAEEQCESCRMIRQCHKILREVIQQEFNFYQQIYLMPYSDVRSWINQQLDVLKENYGSMDFDANRVRQRCIEIEALKRLHEFLPRQWVEMRNKIQDASKAGQSYQRQIQLFFKLSRMRLQWIPDFRF